MTTDETSPLLHDSASERTTYTHPDDDVPDPEGFAAKKPPAIQMASIVIPMAVGVFLAAMDNTIIVSSYAAIGSELKQLQNTSWVATGYMLTLTSFQPLYGKLSDIFGRKSCLLFAYAIFAVGSLLCGAAQTMTQLIAARAFAGVGGGGMTTISSIIMSDIVPLRSRGTWQGIMNIAFACGSAAGAPLGGILADGIGWRWSFFFQVPLTAVAILAAIFVLQLPKTCTGDLWPKLKRVDFVGAFALVSSTFLLLFGLDRGGNISWSDKVTLITLVAFFILFVFFCVIEMGIAKEPFAPRRIIVNGTLISSYLTNFFGLASNMTMLFHISLYFQAVQAKTAVEAGLWLLPSIVGAMAGSLVGGLTMQATGKFYWITVAGNCAIFFGALVTVLFTGIVGRSMVGLVIGLVIASLGNGSVITTSLIAIIANAGSEDQAIATAVSYLFRSLGSVIGLSVGSTLIQDTLRSSLRKHLSGVDVDEVIRQVRESLGYIDRLDPITRGIVRSSYEDAVHATLWFTVGLGFCAAFFSIFIKEKTLVR